MSAFSTFHLCCIHLHKSIYFLSEFFRFSSFWSFTTFVKFFYWSKSRGIHSFISNLKITATVETRFIFQIQTNFASSVISHFEVIKNESFYLSKADKSVSIWKTYQTFFTNYLCSLTDEIYFRTKLVSSLRLNSP